MITSNTSVANGKCCSPDTLPHLDQITTDITVSGDSERLLPTASDWSPYDEQSREAHSDVGSVCSWTDTFAAELYNQGQTSRKTALIGLISSLVISFSCIAFGAVIVVRYPITLAFELTSNHALIIGKLPSLGTTFIITACTESIGLIHSKTLQYKLLSESEPQFNTNLRLFSALPHSHWNDPNGTLCNIVMAILLVMSYVSSSLIFTAANSFLWEDNNFIKEYANATTLIAYQPLFCLGIVLILQVMLALAGMHGAKILTWSSSPFHATAALLHHNKLTRKPGKCMHSVLHFDSLIGPRSPSELQPSAWQAHPSVKKIVIILWLLVPAFAIWACALGEKVSIQSWGLLPNNQTAQVEFGLTHRGHWNGSSNGIWAAVVITIAVAQGSITMVLHCSELIVNLLRDEIVWRKASGKSGAKLASGPISAFMGSWPNVGLLAAKGVLRELYLPMFSLCRNGEINATVDWMFGLCLNINATDITDYEELNIGLVKFRGYNYALSMRPVQVGVLTVLDCLSSD